MLQISHNDLHVLVNCISKLKTALEPKRNYLPAIGPKVDLLNLQQFLEHADGLHVFTLSKTNKLFCCTNINDCTYLLLVLPC